jgi:precorrin-2 dehydrogenase / sirohydrochlorin ferrochelatase
MTDWYPVMLNIEDQRCVVIGGGPVAQRKAAGLLQANADVHLISPSFTQALLDWEAEGRVRLTRREAEDKDLLGARLVFVATDRPEVNDRFAIAARERGILVNAAEDGESGDFLLPAVLRQGGLVLTASASGASPALATRIVQELGQRYGPEYRLNIDLLRTIRSVVKAEVKEASERRRLLQASVSDDALAEWRQADKADWLRDSGKLIARLRQRADDWKG